MEHHSIHCKVTGTAGIPSTDQLTAINRYTLREFAADECYLRTAVVAHNAIDRDAEVFSLALLNEFVFSLPGKGLFIKHPMSMDGDTGPGTGRIIAARLKTMSFAEARALLQQPDLQWPADETQAVLLEVDLFIPNNAHTSEIISNIDAGVAKDVSIGFRATSRTDIADATGNVIARRLHAPGEAYEVSLVWLGAQPGARIVKAAAYELKALAVTQPEVKDFSNPVNNPLLFAANRYHNTERSGKRLFVPAETNPVKETQAIDRYLKEGKIVDEFSNPLSNPLLFKSVMPGPREDQDSPLTNPLITGKYQ